ncbi:MAG: hypothetical protein ACTS9Y_05265 [Methylophilus sp.]|uniref:hypothetical protein n=1 Tax=Methylophilus sp. TaxID=29541 RepID=UPI003F9F3E7F
MTDSNKWIEVISAINEKTQLGKIKWQSRPNPITAGVANISLDSGLGLATLAMNSGVEYKPVGAAFLAAYANKYFRVYKYSRVSKGSGFFALSNGTYYRLEVLDSEENVVLEIPETTGLSDLYQSIQYQVTGVDDLIKSILED